MTRRPPKRSGLARRLITRVVTLAILGGPLGAAYASGWSGGQLGAVGWLVLALLTVMAAMGWGLVMSLAGPVPATAAQQTACGDALPRRWREPAGDRESRRRRERPMTLELPLTTSERLAANS